MSSLGLQAGPGLASGDERAPRRVRLMAYPRRGANPYLEGLYGALSRHGIDVDEESSFVRSCMRGARPDFVHYHWPENFYKHHLPFRQLDRAAWFFTRLKWQRAAGARVLFTFHNRNAHEAAWPTLHRWARKRMVAMSDIILINFEGAREELSAQYGRTQGIWHVPHGSYRGLYPDTLTRAEARCRLFVPEEARVFLLFGDLRDYKHADRAIEAFKQLDAHTARLWVVGRPQRNEQAEGLRQLAASDRRISLVLERVADADVQLYFRAADLLLMPREAFSSGTAVLAFDFGLPILAPRKHHIAELAIGEACFDLTDLSVLGLTEALRAQLTRDLRRARTDAARSTAGLSWDPIGLELATRLQNALSPAFAHG